MGTTEQNLHNSFRKSWDQHFLTLAQQLSLMSTCYRASVGCVLVDSRHHILGSGFNGVPPGWPHCKGSELLRCPGAGDLARTGVCLSNHAETNALLDCRDRFHIETCYVTMSPCFYCIKQLLCTSTHRIVFLEFSSAQADDKDALRLWVNGPRRSPEWVTGRVWEQYTGVL